MTGPDTHTERYELIDRVAVGGMAEVYRAKSFGAHGFEKTLAIKRILPELAAEAEFEDRFISEAKLAVGLSHANIVQVMDFGRFAGSLFIAMEYVDGMDLAGLLKFLGDHGRKVPIPAAFQIAIEICRGLEFAHKHDVIHRDVSPSNILLSKAGEVKVADFGIAQAVTTRSSSGGWKKIMGKWRYMSPEQTRGENLSTQSDIFSLASMLYELFTSEKLFPGDNAEVIAQNIDAMTIPSASSVREGLPERFDSVLFGALERSLDFRTQTAEAMQRQLTEICYESAILATPLDVAELISGIVAEATAEATERSKKGGAGIDDLIRAQLVEGLAAPDPTRRTAVEDADEAIDAAEGGDRKTAVTSTASAIVSKRTGDDGITVWEIDRETIAAAPAAMRGGSRRTGSLSAITDAVDPPETERRRRALGIVVGLVVAALALAGVIAFAVGGDDSNAVAGADARDGASRQTDARAVPPAGRTMLRIDSVPPGATVFLADQELAMATPTSVAVEPGVANRVRLALAGYEPWEDREVQVPKGETMRIRPRLKRRVATLVVATRPEGAVVELDGKRLGLTPLERLDLEPGSKLLVLRKDGFKPVSVRVELQAGTRVRIERALRDTTVFGSINLQIDDGWAEVYFRGKKVGRAPVRGLKLPVGKHRLRLYNPQTKKKRILDVNVVVGETRYYRTRL